MGSHGKRLRRARRRLAFRCMQLTAAVAALFGAAGVRAFGGGIGWLNFHLGRRREPWLADHLARALEQDVSTGRDLLATSCQVNDRAIFEVVALSVPWMNPEALVRQCRIEGLERLQDIASAGRGAVLLGMHMGNGILMAAQLARAGLPVSVVYRESRKMPAGFLGRVLTRAGLDPIHAERDNPGPGNRKMLRSIRGGRLVYVLMDQGSKHDGLPVPFLGKTVRMPVGIVKLARRTGAPLVPVLPEAAEPEWHFRVHDPVLLPAEDDQAVRAVAALMERQIRRHPGLWAWQHRRWRRYPFLSESNVS